MIYKNQVKRKTYNNYRGTTKNNNNTTGTTNIDKNQLSTMKGKIELGSNNIFIGDSSTGSDIIKKKKNMASNADDGGGGFMQ